MSQPLHALILEDRAPDAQLMVAALGQAGFELRWQRVESEADYLAYLGRAPDIILADYTLPQFDAVRALKLLQERDLDIPFIIVSGSIGEDIAVSALLQGADDYLLKDRLGRLGRAVSQALERKRMRLRQREVLDALHLRERALEAFSQGMLITDASRADEPIIYANSGFEKITGYKQAEVLGRNSRFLQGPDTDPATRAQIGEALREHRPIQVEILNYRKDGQSFWNDLTITPLRDPQGKVTHHAGVQNDVTGRKHLEEQIRQAQKIEAVGRLAGGVAHDFNNLLTVITGYSEVILTRLRQADPLRELVEQIMKAGERAANLTRQLLAFSRKQLLVPTILDLNALLADMEKMLRRLIGEDVELVFLPDPELWRVKADEGQMEQVILNVALNARDAMPQGGMLTLTTSNVALDEDYVRAHPQVKAGEHVLVAVRDTGCGMDAATIAKIFEPFFTTKGPEQGTGLGLATVFGIVKQSGGHVDVVSEPGVGSTFKVYLPRAREGLPVGKAHSDLKVVPRGSETILLVEDEDGVRTLARLVLRQCGYQVLEARHGGEALLICEQFKDVIHLLVTDVVMPNMSGRQVAERLRALQPNMKILYLSGYTDDAIVRHGVLEGDMPFLQKPFTPPGLAQKVREVLDAR